MMADKAWKQFERRVAEDFGTKRNPLSGINSGITGSDTRHANLFIESKHNKDSPFWRLYLKARPTATKEGKAVVLCLGKTNHPGYMLAVHSDDFPILVVEWLRSRGLTSSVEEVLRSLAGEGEAHGSKKAGTRKEKQGREAGKTGQARQSAKARTRSRVIDR